MRNERGAGRKSKLSSQDLQEVLRRRSQGESIASIAASFDISRQALSQKIKNISANHEITIDYMVDGLCVTRIIVDTDKQDLRITNYVRQISQTAFGLTQNPNWVMLGAWLESWYHRFPQAMQSGAMVQLPLCMECGRKDFTLQEILDQLPEDLQAYPMLRESGSNVDPNTLRFEFRRQDLLYARTDTDGFQFKALSKDRRWFVKAQALFSGLPMNDWAVEVIASDLCRQLGIPHVEQMPCEFVYEGRSYHGVYSANFELDGMTFISFEKLLERTGCSTRDEEFIARSSIDKLYWCADHLAQAGNLPREAAIRYMLDLAVIDCLVGNVDRHTRNFGLFFNTMTGQFEIPLIFDNGMGLFEHDYYRDQNTSYEDAMRNVYVSPYGEDPFEFIVMLDAEFDLLSTYPALRTLTYPRQDVLTPWAEEYEERMCSLWQK